VIDRSAETSSTEGSPSVSAVVETMVETGGDGERVRILGGPLADVEGILVHTKPNKDIAPR
jgi:hypothetical protein